MTSQSTRQNPTGEAAVSHLPSEPAQPYHPAALASATDLLRRAVSPDAATVFSAVATLRPRGSAEREVGLATLTSLADLGSDPTIAAERLFVVDDALFRQLGVRLMVLSDEADSRRRKGARRWPASAAVEYSEAASAQPSSITLSDELCALLDAPHPAPSGLDLPMVDTVTATWVKACRAAARSGTGHHLALRVLAEDGREVSDFAGLVAANGSRVDLVTGATRSTLMRAVLRAELHAGESGHVVVVAGLTLFEEAKEADDDEYGETSWTTALKPDSAEAKEARLWLPGVRATYVWQAPATGALPRAFDGLIGGCAGPTGFDRAWSEGVVAAVLPGLDKIGVAALLAQVRDPRDALAMASMARAAASGTGSDLRATSAFVARSFGARAGGLVPAQAPPPAFDPRLLVCDHDVALLLLSAPALAQHGGRVLFWGPPGGGKSSFAQALARGMPGRPALSVTPADVLAYRWGAMERRLTNIWTKAASEGAVLVVDELDSLCGAREGGSGNNAYLIRCLTDEWLRHLDAHPSVPVLATVNDPAAVDDAIRRRFTFVIHVGDELSPEQERLAWTSLLALEPPAGWTPCGAAVADIALAKARCRMLGQTDTADLADAIVRAREARLGPVGARRRAPRSGSVH